MESMMKPSGESHSGKLRQGRSAGKWENLFVAFLEQAEQSPDAPAIEFWDTGESVSYGQLLTMAERYKALLSELGVTAGETVLVMLPSGPDFTACLCASFSLAAISVPVSPLLTDFELTPILNDAQPAVCITDSANAKRSLIRTSSCRHVHCVEQGLPEAQRSLSIPSGDPVATCHFTYKGLGYPLGALHRRSHYASALASMVRPLQDDEPHTFLAALPLVPIFGFTMLLLCPLAMGGRVLLVQHPTKADLMKIVASRRIRLAGVVPELLAHIVAHAARQGEPLSSLHPDFELVSGASWLPPELLNACLRSLGVRCFQGYGTTETMPIVCNRPQKDCVGSLGSPVRSDIGVRIVDHQGIAVGPGRVGEIVVSGPTLASGYLRRPDETARFLRNGEFFTGDLGYRDEDGFLFFKGRRLAFTKVLSQMVDLVEVENLLLRHPAVARVTTTVQARGTVGSIVVAWVILRSGMHASVGELQEFCRRSLSRHKIPYQFEILSHRQASFRDERASHQLGTAGGLS